MNIFEKIGMLFKTAINKFFTKTLDDIKPFEKDLHDAGQFTYNLYNFAQEHQAEIDAFKAIVPTTWDDVAINTIENALPKIAANFTAFADDIKNATSISDLVIRMSNTIKTLDKDAFTFVTHNIASFVGTELARLKNPNTLLGKIFTVIESVWQAFTKPEVVPQP